MFEIAEGRIAILQAAIYTYHPKRKRHCNDEIQSTQLYQRKFDHENTK
jgi:hypothetical protein